MYNFMNNDDQKGDEKMGIWFNELESCASEDCRDAATNAGPFECGIWQLPSGKYIALQQGPPVPTGSTLVAIRVTPDGVWKDAKFCGIDF